MDKWKVEDMQVGDYISVRVNNPHGDRNLDGVIIGGKIKDLEPSLKMVRLDTGWCCHTKDHLLGHVPTEAPQ